MVRLGDPRRTPAHVPDRRSVVRRARQPRKGVRRAEMWSPSANPEAQPDSSEPVLSLIPYGGSDGGAAGWRYQQIALTDATDYSSPAFDDSAWASGSTSFGQGGSSYIGGTAFATVWERGTRIWIRRADIPEKSGYRVYVQHDDDAQIYWNGTLIADFPGSATGDDIPGDEVAVPASAIVAGAQAIAVRCSDTSEITESSGCKIDVRITGD